MTKAVRKAQILNKIYLNKMKSITSKEAAELCGIHVKNASVLLLRCMRQGLLSRVMQRVGVHGHEYRYSLTEKGRKRAEYYMR